MFKLRDCIRSKRTGILYFVTAIFNGETSKFYELRQTKRIDMRIVFAAVAEIHYELVPLTDLETKAT